jgi:hypothetical protein
MPPFRTRDKNASPAQLALQENLAITPKTAKFLIQLGYTDYRDLRHATPNEVMEKLIALPGWDKKKAEGYRRAFRRMVWLGTQDDPVVKARETAHPSYWTMKGLIEKGIWVEGYDDLTGDEVQEKFLVVTV